MTASAITSWLLTYLIHSTVFLGSAWLISKILGESRLALQETLLRGALIGGLLTATIQLGFGLEPIGGALAIDGYSHSVGASAGIPPLADTALNQVTAQPAAAAHTSERNLWPSALMSLWALGSLLALLVLGRSVLDLKRLLRTRRFRSTDRLFDRLAMAMGLRKRVRLSTSAAIAIPFATGVRQPEICCPERVGELAREHRKSLFAHELAHLARRDPAWQLFYRIGEALFFMQPLNRIIRTRLEQIAEHLTDERAAATTGDRLGLARCLVVVAHWGVSSPPGVPATAFAAGPRLDSRVRHLISGAFGQRRKAPWTAPLLAALLVISVLLLPAITSSTAHADLSPTGSNAVPLRTWSLASTTAETGQEPPPPAPEPPPVDDLPMPVEPAPVVAPVADTVPRAQAGPAPVPVPDTGALPAPAAAPEPGEDTTPPPAPEPASETTPPTPPTAPEPPEQTDKKSSQPAPEASSSGGRRAPRPAPEKPSLGERERSREEARARQREASRERAEAAQRARALHEERRALSEQARELAREAAGYSELTAAEREKLRDAAREIREQPRAEQRELARVAAERARLSATEREDLRRQVEVLRAEARELAQGASREAREHARQLAEEARQLAEEEEARRRQEKQ